MNPELLDRFAIFEDLDPVALLADNRTRVAADKGIAPEMLAAFDRFEKERFTGPPDFSISRQRGFDIRE